MTAALLWGEHTRTDKGNQHMASQTRPFLMTGAALVSAAAVVAATPMIAPSTTALPLTVSTSGVNLATFSDIFTIPSAEWTASFFQGYGGIVGPKNPMPLEPWASQCDTKTGPGCYVAGPSGVAYLALDALINGNGKGWSDNANWGVGAVNYFFEGGTPSAGAEYLLQQSVGAANPVLGVLITLLFTGPQLVPVVYDNALQLLGNAALGIPLLGNYVYGVINSYLGYASLDPAFRGYTQGLSGVLNYAVDVLTGNAPSPTPPKPPASSAVLAAAPAAAATALAGHEVQAAVSGADTVPAAETAGPSASDAAVAGPSASDTAVAGPSASDAVKAAASKEEAAAGRNRTGTDAGSTSETATATAQVTPAVDSPAGTVAATGADSSTTTSATADTSASASGATADTSVKARKRPVRDAVEKVTKSIGSALKGDKAGATG